MLLIGMTLSGLLACSGGQEPVFDPAQGLLGQGITWPFPNAQLIQDGQVAIPGDELPLPEGASPLPVERVAWRLARAA